MKTISAQRVVARAVQEAAAPTMGDCIEVVMKQSPDLMREVLAGLQVTRDRLPALGLAGQRNSVGLAVLERLRSCEATLVADFVQALGEGVRHGGPLLQPEPVSRAYDPQRFLNDLEIDAGLEQALARDEMGQAVADLLPQFNALVSTLLGWVTVQPQLNRLQPEVFVQALLRALARHLPDAQQRLTVVAPAAGLMGLALHRLYNQLVGWLMARGVEPALPPQALQQALSEPHEACSGVVRTLVGLDRMEKLLRTSGMMAPSGEVPEFIHTVPASYVALEDMKLLDSMMRRLVSRPRDAAVTDASARPAQSVQRELGAEVVRLMLDTLVQDGTIVPAMRKHLVRLERPLLELVESDARFFSDAQHPARRLLDSLASHGRAGPADLELTMQMNPSIAAAVDELCDLGGRAEHFAAVLGKLEQLWARAQRRLHQQRASQAEAVALAARANEWSLQLAQRLLARPKGKEIPPWAVDFLCGPWSRVMASSQHAHGAEDPVTRGYEALVEDLLWSVQVRKFSRNRRRLALLVPAMLTQLREGLKLIDHPQEASNQFFDALIGLHESTFERLRAQARQEEATPSVMEAGESVLDPGALDVEPEPEAEAGDSLLQALKVGDWVELESAGGWVSAQLTWVSASSKLFMFVSGRGLAHTMSRRSIERLVQRGALRLERPR